MLSANIAAVRKHRWDANKLSFECKHYHSRQSLRSGTVMEHSKLSTRYWIAAMFLLTSTRKGRPAKVVVHLKMKVIPNLGANTITNVVKEQLESSVELTTEDSTSYVKFNELVESHQTVTSGKETVKNFLPWVHIAISNAKRLLLDVHHYIKIEYLQYYLNEFCYKFNRRYFGEKLFDRVVIAAITYNTDFKSRSYKRTLCG